MCVVRGCNTCLLSYQWFNKANVFTNFFFSVSEMTFHYFCIAFTTSLSLLFPEFHSHIKNTRSHMLYCCQLYLEFCFFGFCIFFKNLEYKVDSIPRNGSDFFESVIEVKHLMRFEDISKNQ